MGRPENWPAGAWSHSRWAELRRCPKAHDLRYNKRIYLIGDKPEALDIGSGFHRALEHVGRVAMAGESTDDRDVWDDALRRARSEIPPKAGIEVTRLWGAYQKRWGFENAGYGEGLQVIAVEEVLLGGDLHQAIGGYAAIADAVVEDDDGLWVVETKTAGRKPSGSDEEIRRDIAMQDQVLGLTHCGRERWGARVKGVLRNVVIKTNLVGFLRMKVEIPNEAVENWLCDQMEAEQLVGLTCANRDACAPMMGFRCDYFDYCHAASMGAEPNSVDEKYETKESR